MRQLCVCQPTRKPPTTRPAAIHARVLRGTIAADRCGDANRNPDLYAEQTCAYEIDPSDQQPQAVHYRLEGPVAAHYPRLAFIPHVKIDGQEPKKQTLVGDAKLVNHCHVLHIEGSQPPGVSSHARMR